MLLILIQFIFTTLLLQKVGKKQQTILMLNGDKEPSPVSPVVGFVVGGVVCILVDIFASNWLDDLIDKIAK